jgi:diguanylate cyclase (GGDEF)-like protein
VLLEQRIEHASLRARRSHADAAVLFVDLDNFKTVNDTHGHAVGDSLLIGVAKRLAGLLRPGDTLARLSGDEFVILCEDLHGMSDVEVLAARVEGAFDTSFPLVTADGHQVDALVTASIGMAYAGRAEDIGDSLVRDADAAMYQTKRKGGAGHQVLDLREAKRVAARQQLQRDLHRAFLRDELDLAYQPIVHPGDGRMTGVEALLRWTHPTHGPIPALTMVDVAEQNSLIVDVGTWVLHRACAQRMQWRQRWPEMPLDLAVNVSTTQIMGAGFLETVAHVLAETGMEASALTLEITESILIDDSARALAVLADLKTLGVRLALDDFGTGYSSLSYLRRFPVDIVKIDQGFVSDIGLLPNGGSILRAVTELVHVLGLSVTAEGVETPQQREEVVAIGCEWAQGYLYAHPLPPAGIDLRIQTLPLAERGNAALPDSGAQQLA